MKTLKIMIAALLAAAMLLSMASCSIVKDVLSDIQDNGDDNDDRNNNNNDDDDDDDDEDDDDDDGNVGDVGDVGGSADTNSSADTDGGADTEAADTNAKGGTYSTSESGSVTYVNNDIGVSATFDSDWTVSPRSELATLTGVVADNMDDEQLAELIRQSQTFFDLSASSNDLLRSVNIVYEDLGVVNGLLISEEEYLDASFASIEASAESIGYTESTITKTTASIAGKSHPAVAIKGTISGIQVYQLQLCIKSGRYILVLTCTSYLDDVTGDILGMFH